MQPKFELKMKLKQLDRTIDEVKFKEQQYYSKLQLAEKAKGTSLYKKAFDMVERDRESWYKIIDNKMKLEQDIKVLKEKVIAEVLKEIK